MKEIEKVCVVAAGAIGSLLVGHLGTVVDMAVLARRDEHAKALNAEGLRVSGKSELHADVRASTDAAELGDVDLVIIASKALAVEACAGMIEGHFPGAHVLMIQNGLGCEEMVSRFGDWPIISGVTFMSGTRHTDTHVEYELDTATWMGPWAEGSATYEYVRQVEQLFIRSGLKAEAYEDLLHGYVGYQQVEVNAQGRKIRQIYREPPESSKDLYLTIDASMQILAVQALNGRRGSIVIMDTNTGAVLVSASSPGYNPNLFVDGIDRNIYADLLRSKDTPLLNRTLQGKYPPGSTIKPMLALGGLSHQVREPGSETWCPGWYSLKGSSRRYRDWKKEGHGHMDMVHAISQSCDVYFYVLAQDMEIDLIHQTLTDFGLGKQTGIDIGGEADGLIPSTQWKRAALGQPWYPGETLIAGIGQGATLVTPIQLAVATAVIANRGKLVRPYLLSEVRDSATGQQVIRASAHEGRQVISASPEDWDVIIHSMQEVVHGERGTARSSGAGTEYQFAGKTGTAQVITIGQDEEYDEDEIPEELRDHALFIAFAPVESPEIALAVIVENGGGGSRTAAPLARELLDHYFSRQKRFETG